MKNISDRKSSESESSKTPGGISKSLLTPCRRIGLSRNWKKAGPSPFVSPLSGGTPSKVELKDNNKVTRKRKESEDIEEETVCTPKTTACNDELVDIDESDTSSSLSKNADLSSTPTRHIEVPRRKKSKTLLSALNKNAQESVPVKIEDENMKNGKQDMDKTILPVEENAVTPVQKSRSRGKKTISPKVSHTKKTQKDDCNQQDQITTGPIQDKGENVVNVIHVPESKCNVRKIISPKRRAMNNEFDTAKETTGSTTEKRSPKELTKECIVVIQKKIFEIDEKKNDKPKPSSDSDSDEVPLGQLSRDKQVLKNTEHDAKILQNHPGKQEKELDDDFEETKSVKKLDKATSVSSLKKKLKNTKSKLQTKKLLEPSQNSDYDEEDDFDFDNKKTILIRKTYEKVVKPQKARSTGSITQKDIDDLKARIESKKKLLLARALTGETEELRSLIKKWQKGCQDALMELMELMKNKFPDKQNMDYSEMLSMLKIPASLVGYDSDSECFNTPDDASIILSKFNDL